MGAGAREQLQQEGGRAAAPSVLPSCPRVRFGHGAKGGSWGTRGRPQLPIPPEGPTRSERRLTGRSPHPRSGLEGGTGGGLGVGTSQGPGDTLQLPENGSVLSAPGTSGAGLLVWFPQCPHLQVTEQRGGTGHRPRGVGWAQGSTPPPSVQARGGRSHRPGACSVGPAPIEGGDVLGATGAQGWVVHKRRRPAPRGHTGSPPLCGAQAPPWDTLRSAPTRPEHHPRDGQRWVPPAPRPSPPPPWHRDCGPAPRRGSWGPLPTSPRARASPRLRNAAG